MVDDGLTRGMTEWVAGHVLRYHLGIDAHLLGQDGVWRNGVVPPLASDRTVGLLGLGELGRAVAAALGRPRLRRARLEPAARASCRASTSFAGEDGLEAVLRAAGHPRHAAAGDARPPRTCSTPAGWRCCPRARG